MHVWQTLCQLIYTLIFSHSMPNHPYILNSAPHVFPFFSHIIYLLAGSFPSAQKQVDTSPIFKMIMIPNPPRIPRLTTHPFLLLRANLHDLPSLFNSNDNSSSTCPQNHSSDVISDPHLATSQSLSTLALLTFGGFGKLLLRQAAPCLVRCYSNH